jgi:hypothetical protein
MRNSKRAASFLVLALMIFAFAGCSLVSGSSPTATIRDYHRFAENDNPEAMVKLYSKGYLEKNTNALEGCRAFVDLVKRTKAAGHPPSLSDLKETLVGEQAIVKGYYGSNDGSGGIHSKVV